MLFSLFCCYFHFVFFLFCIYVRVVCKTLHLLLLTFLFFTVLLFLWFFLSEHAFLALTNLHSSLVLYLCLQQIFYASLARIRVLRNLILHCHYRVICWWTTDSCQPMRRSHPIPVSTLFLHHSIVMFWCLQCFCSSMVANPSKWLKLFYCDLDWKLLLWRWSRIWHDHLPRRPLTCK